MVVWLVPPTERRVSKSKPTRNARVWTHPHATLTVYRRTGGGGVNRPIPAISREKNCEKKERGSRAAHLMLKRSSDVVLRDLSVFLEGLQQLWTGPKLEDFIEDGLIGAPLLLASIVDLLSFLLGLLHVNRGRLVPVALATRDQEPLEMAAGFGNNVLCSQRATISENK